MVFALKEQNRIIGQLRREANANFMLLDDRSRRTQDMVQKLVGKVRMHVGRLMYFRTRRELWSEFGMGVGRVLPHSRFTSAFYFVAC